MLEGIEVPREAQLACQHAWAWIFSLSCSSRGLLSPCCCGNPSTRGGLSFQGLWAGAHDLWPPEEPDRRPDDTELSPSWASSPAVQAGQLQACPRGPGLSMCSVQAT